MRNINLMPKLNFYFLEKSGSKARGVERVKERSCGYLRGEPDLVADGTWGQEGRECPGDPERPERGRVMTCRWIKCCRGGS